MENQTQNNNLPQHNEATQKKEWVAPEMQQIALTAGLKDKMDMTNTADPS
jgi:hypothetical protein